jgi:hypothetical protein
MATISSTNPVVWRTKLRSTLPGVNHAEQESHCFDNGVIGIGWGVDTLTDGAAIKEVLAAVRGRKKQPGWKRAEPTVRRFAVDMKDGDFIWVRDTDAAYRLCRVKGAYRYAGGPAAKKVDLHHLRDVDWAPRPLEELQVPAAVKRTFIGRGSTFSRVKNPGAQQLTVHIWERLQGRSSRASLTPEEVLTNHLDPYDVEDLIWIWLQVARDYVCLPRSRQRGTPKYEWSMIHRTTGARGIVQIKTGATPVDLVSLSKVAARSTRTFAYAACGGYLGDRSLVSEIITDEALLAFVRDRPEMVPEAIRAWFDMCAPTQRGVASRSQRSSSART